MSFVHSLENRKHPKLQGFSQCPQDSRIVGIECTRGQRPLQVQRAADAVGGPWTPLYIILLFDWFKALCVVLAIQLRASHILGLSYTPKTCTPF